MLDREKVIGGLESLKKRLYDSQDILDGGIVGNAIALLKAQEPRVMDVDEVIACEKGAVLWVEERQGVIWNLFPLEIDVNSIHPDTGTAYLFFITYHDLRKFECDEYNQTWRCWTERPTKEQREDASWQK